MKLLSTETWEISDFISDEVDKYAILSHTWSSAEEVSFQQWESRASSSISHLGGYSKIKSFGEQAATAGYKWIWVDT